MFLNSSPWSRYDVHCQNSCCSVWDTNSLIPSSHSSLPLLDWREVKRNTTEMLRWILLTAYMKYRDRSGSWGWVMSKVNYGQGRSGNMKSTAVKCSAHAKNKWLTSIHLTYIPSIRANSGSWTFEGIRNPMKYHILLYKNLTISSLSILKTIQLPPFCSCSEAREKLKR